MTLFDVIILLCIVLFISQFWRLRSLSECAKQHLEEYCDSQNIQLISVARKKTRLGTVQGKIDFICEFEFEFSGNGENSYIGLLSMKGKTVTSTHLPAYKVN